MNLFQVASGILNNIEPHITNASININQLMDELVETASAVIHEYQIKKLLQTEQFEALSVEINCVPVECKDISECCDEPSGVKVLVAEIPKLAYYDGVESITYVGTIDRAVTYRRVYGNTYLYAKHAKYTSAMPTVWVRNVGEKTLLVLLNPPSYDIKVISVTFKPQNIQDITAFSCTCDEEDLPFNVPMFLISTIRQRVEDRYMRQYTMGHTQQNTQSELIASKQ